MIPGYPTLNKLGGFFLKKFYFLPILTSWWWRTPTWRPTSILTGKACWCYRWCCCWCCCCCWPALGWSWQMSSCCCCCCLLFLLFLGISYQAKREDDNLNQTSKSILRALLGKKLLQKISMCLSNGRGTSDKIRPQKWVFFLSVLLTDCPKWNWSHRRLPSHSRRLKLRLRLKFGQKNKKVPLFCFPTYEVRSRWSQFDKIRTRLVNSDVPFVKSWRGCSCKLVNFASQGTLGQSGGNRDSMNGFNKYQ